MNHTPSPNFAFLAYHDPRLVALGTQAEEHFATDPNVTLIKLRQFCEVLAKRAAAKVGLLVNPREEQRRVIDALSDRGAIGATQRDLFHQVRRLGNEAVHDFAGTQGEALHQLKIAHQLAIWFQRIFGNNRQFDPGPLFLHASRKRQIGRFGTRLNDYRSSPRLARRSSKLPTRPVPTRRGRSQHGLFAQYLLGQPRRALDALSPAAELELRRDTPHAPKETDGD